MLKLAYATLVLPYLKMGSILSFFAENSVTFLLL